MSVQKATSWESVKSEWEPELVIPRGDATQEQLFVVSESVKFDEFCFMKNLLLKRMSSEETWSVHCSAFYKRAFLIVAETM